MLIDLNHASGFVYGAGIAPPLAGSHINALIDAALVARERRQRPRDYLGASRIGEPCARKLVYEYTGAPKDEGKTFGGGLFRIFDAGHRFEALTIEWLRAAGFDLRTHDRAGDQFGFSIVGGRFRGHIDGVIVAGPDLGIAWPALWEHKALKAKGWTDLVKRGVREAKPIYFAQLQIYMAYMALAVAVLTAMNKDTQELHHEIVPFDAAAAQLLSDKAAGVLRAAGAGELPPRIAATADFYLCRMCAYARRCWETGA